MAAGSAGVRGPHSRRLRIDPRIRQFGPAMKPLSPAGYTIRLLAIMAGVLLAVWTYVLLAPLAFLPSGYPSWVAKLTMLRECQPAAIDFFGDSRVEAGIIPAVLPVAANNLGVAGGTPVEVESGVRRALRCSAKPGLVVIALGSDRFGPLGETFWVESLGYGFMTFHDLRDLERRASMLGDSNTLGDARTQEGLSGPIRDWLYRLDFPSMSFSNLLQGQIFRRYGSNIARLGRIRQARGFVPYPALPPTDRSGPEAKQTRFATTPLQLAALEATLATLRDSSVPVALLLMPVKKVTSDAMAPDMKRAYLDYLRSLSTRFSNIRIIGADIPAWPSTMFTDAVHLNAAGAERFSARLAECIEGASIRSNCDLDWDARLSRADPTTADPTTADPTAGVR